MTDILPETRFEQEITRDNTEAKVSVARRFGHYLFTLNRERRDGNDAHIGTLDHIPTHIAFLAVTTLAMGIDFSDLAESDRSPGITEIIKRTAKTNSDRIKILKALPKEWQNPFKRYFK